MPLAVNPITLIRALGRFAPRFLRGEEKSTPTTQLLQSALSNPATAQALRGHYARRHDGEHVEFLLASSSFDRSTNALQRFEQLRHIIHRFVHPRAERPIALQDESRAQVLEEWSWWSGGNRVPTAAVLPALRAATEEVARLVEEQKQPPDPLR